MKKWIVANWKMNGTLESARRLATELVELSHTNPFSAHIVICPPFPHLGIVALRLTSSSLELGAQDCSAYEEGAYTGQVSASMLKDIACRYVILGHSERRTSMKEDDALVHQKAQAALIAGLTPIICVGETLEEREQGKAIETVISQVKQAVPKGKCLIAYEPVWAIGTGKSPNSAQIQEINQAIAKESPENGILYGGSVKSANAPEILCIPHVNGLLIGGASLNAHEFWKIVEASQR
jgi:triosephosphate isomerase